MPVDLLENATELIKQGKQAEAQDLLQRLLTADPHNLPAWACYLQTCSTDQERMRVLGLCLKHNPDSKDAIQALKNHLALAGRQDTPQPHKANPGRNVKEIVLSIVPIILYGLAIAGMIAEIRFAIDDFSAPKWGDSGFGRLAVLFFWIVFLGAQWVILNAIPSLYILLRKRKRSVTKGVVGLGILAGIAAIIHIAISTIQGLSVENLGPWALGILEIAPFAFIFGFTSGSGPAALLILIFDAIVNTIELFLDSSI